MSESEDNNQVITKYLLGSLAEAETERLDELSFTDDVFAEALKSVEKDLVDSFARGELEGEALEKFKSHYLASPLRREKAEFAKAFQIFAERSLTEANKENIALQKSTLKQTISNFFSSALNIFVRPYPALTWGLIAAALAIICLGGWWLEVTSLTKPTNDTRAEQDSNGQSHDQDQQNQPNVSRQVNPNPDSEKEQAQLSEDERAARRAAQELKKEQAQQEQQNQQRLAKENRAPQQQSLPVKPSIASFVLVLPMRDAASIQKFPIPAQTDLVNMRLPLESDDYAGYYIALTDQSGGKKLWRSGKLKTKGSGENKILNIRFPAKLLKSQIYSLTVSGVGSDGAVEIIGDYPFRAVLR